MDDSSLKKTLKQAMQLQQAGALDQAKALYLQVLETQPGNADARHLYGLACHQQGDHKTAIRYIRQAVEMAPDQPVLRNNLGNALRKARDFEGAIEQLEQALQLRPGYGGAHMNLSLAYAGLHDHDASLAHGREAVRYAPQLAEAWGNLAIYLIDHMMLDEAIHASRAALALRPAYPEAVGNLMWLLNLLPGADPVEVAEEHHRVITGLLGSTPDAPASTASNERIRIGYVSGDFCDHAVNLFFEPVLEHHDKSCFETYCYSNVARPDPVTRRLRELAEHWRDISDVTGEAAAAQIRADRIDILVDLAGHTQNNRLDVFARKPARCQISYLGYPNTTGLAAMDYRVVDQYTVPGDEPPTGTEKLVRLPSVFACFRPPAGAPAIRTAPVAKNGFITFGSVHKLEKLNSAVIELWARLLQGNPESRLLIARDQLDDWHQGRLKRAFHELGVDADRLQLVHLVNPADSFFPTISDIDIMLDVFPWSGHTIACCALWMGVPVVTLQGNTHAGRMVASVLNALGLNEFIANDADSYVSAASNLCNDHQRLSTLRSELRSRMEHSPLRDESGYTRLFEAACRKAIRGSE
jgi:predicted O-linked N-acetylglucosamine transferase (SPINDLY family)